MKRKNNKNKNRDLKIIIVGDSGTGKTSFVNRYILNKFADNYQATIATQFSSKILELDGLTYRLQFWDIAGQDRNVTTTNIFCKNTNGIVLCCEVNDKKTLNNVTIWKQSIEQKLDSFSKWLDYLDFLKCYNQSFTAGYQFRKSHLIEQISLDIELKEKAGHLFKKYGVGSYLEIVNKLLQEMLSMGFAECISEQDETYKITSAFLYAEELVNMIQIANEDEIPE